MRIVFEAGMGWKGRDYVRHGEFIGSTISWKFFTQAAGQRLVHKLLQDGYINGDDAVILNFEIGLTLIPNSDFIKDNFVIIKNRRRSAKQYSTGST